MSDIAGDHSRTKANDPAFFTDATRLSQWAGPLPQERPDIWPKNLCQENGQLVLHGYPLSQLDTWGASENQAPVFITDLDDLAERAKNYCQAFNHSFSKLNGAQVHYAAKAFFCTQVARIMGQAGLGLDTASLGELRLAVRSGVDRKLIGLHGNNKSKELLYEAIKDGGIGRIIVDSISEVKRISALLDENPHLSDGKPIGLMIRITTGVHAGGHDFIATAHEDQKFGLSLETVPGAKDCPALECARAIMADKRLKLIGLHSHIGSQIFDLSAFGVAATKAMEFRALLKKHLQILVEEIDLGGGYAVAYTGFDEVAKNPQEIADYLADCVKQVCERLGQPAPRISVEPGRSLVAPTTLTLYRVGNIKDQAIDTDAAGSQVVRRYVSVNGGMSDNIRPALYEASYCAVLANRLGETEDLIASRVVGSHCESGDIVVHNVALPLDLKEGDLLAVPVTGAYGYTMSSNYNMFSRPGVLGLSAAEEPKWLILPENLDEHLGSIDPGYSLKQ